MSAASQLVTDELRRWIIAQAEAGCRPEDLLAAMKVSGWHEGVARAAMQSTLEGLPGERSAMPAPRGTAGAGVRVPEPDVSDGAVVIRAADREVRVLMAMREPRVVVFGGFLAEQECDELVAQARPRMARSETVDHATGGSEVNPVRTSDGMFFTRGENTLIELVERRIAALVNWPLAHGEGLQVLHYRPGAEYRPHHDYFDPAQPGTAAVLRRGGQRVATLLMYLNTPERGGATIFPDVELEVAPVKGNAVFFSYNRPHAATRTLHGGAPVLAGEKWVATKWLREGEFA